MSGEPIVTARASPVDPRPIPVTPERAAGAPGDEAGDVRPERHAARRAARADRPDAAEQLHQEPDAEEEDRRDLDQIEEEEDEDGVSTRECGYRTKYAPITPAIAPLAPIIGTSEYGLITTCPSAASAPQQQVEERGSGGGRTDPRRCRRRSTGRACCRPKCSQPLCRNMLVRIDGHDRNAGTTPNAQRTAGAPGRSAATRRGTRGVEDDEADGDEGSGARRDDVAHREHGGGPV